MDKNDETILTYQTTFKKYIEATPKEIFGDFKAFMDFFLENLPANPRVLEIGSAFGRDAAYMRSKGAEILCTDIIPEALELLSKEGFETAYYDFRDDPKPEWIGAFDGFFANAVLLHADQETLKKAVENILKVLKPHGIASLSFKLGENEGMETLKLNGPRFFKYHSTESLRQLLSPHGVEILRLNLRKDDKWIEVVFRKK